MSNSRLPDNPIRSNEWVPLLLLFKMSFIVEHQFTLEQESIDYTESLEVLPQSQKLSNKNEVSL